VVINKLNAVIIVAEIVTVMNEVLKVILLVLLLKRMKQEKLALAVM
jgi:hypothetical protein